MSIQYHHYPSNQNPPPHLEEIVKVFRNNKAKILSSKYSYVKGTDGKETLQMPNGQKVTSDTVLDCISDDLEKIGFQVEKGKKAEDKIYRPVTFGLNGKPDLEYEIDAYWEENAVGLEVEYGRSTMGNAIYRDLIQGMVMNNVNHLVIAVANKYRYKSNAKKIEKDDFIKCCEICNALVNHGRVELPFSVTIIGY